MTSNPLYPVFLKLEGRPVLLVGGGPVALRRAGRLIAAGARLTIVSPTLIPSLRKLLEGGAFQWKERAFRMEDLDGAALVFFAAGDRRLADEAREEAARRRIPFSAAEDESLSDFHVPAALSLEGVQVAISTGGRSPAAAAGLRDTMEAWLLASRNALEDALARGREPPARGKVYIVGAGPGDPGLLTVRALGILAGADVVYHDRLVSEAILAAIPARVEKVYVGKEVGCAHRADSARLMIEGARQGKTVVRLKGGDPLIFGRGGEEILALRREGIDFEVVPGVTALSSVPAAAGIPLTFRGVAGEIIVRSGHRLDSGPSSLSSALSSALPSALPASPGAATYVYFMAAGRLAAVAEELLGEGLPPATPVAVIQKGTLPDQKVLHSTLGELAEAAEREPVETPALLVAGDVVHFPDLARFLSLIETGVLNEKE